MVPLLTGPLGMRQHAAHGTSLVVIVFAAAASAAFYALDGGIPWATALPLLPASLAGAYVGARGVQRLPAMRLRQCFGLFLLAVAVRLIAVPGAASLVDAGDAVEWGVAALIGLAGGLVCGALGVGGGAIFVPALVILLGVDQHAAQGASLCVIVAAAGVGALTHARHGSLHARSAFLIAPAAVPAGIAGAAVAARIGGDSLQRLFAVVVLVVGVQMILTATRRLRAERALDLAGERVAA
jgi:uncharacterized membrane protein YfcA